MITTLQRFGAWATALRQDEFRYATLRLTFFYVLSTTIILMVSTAAVLLLFAPPETELPFRPQEITTESAHDNWSAYELREHLVAVFLIVDTIILTIVSIVSYYFAQRTLTPIRTVLERQRQFMSDAAHELRTPLSILRSGADILLTRPHTVPEYQEFVTDVQEESARLTRLSDQLLHLLRAGTAHSTVSHSENLSSLCEDEVRRFMHYADRHRIVLHCTVEPGILLNVDKDSIVQLLQNLLKNAVDHTPQGGAVTLTLHSTTHQVVCAVRDNGVGIPQEKQAAIFDRFVKLDTARNHSSYSGAGLGLAIVQAIVTEHHGSIALDSAPEHGTTVTVTFPKTHS